MPFVVLGLSTSSSTSSSLTSSTSSSQDSVIGTENPATEISGSLSAELQWNPLRELAETENANKNEDDEELRGGILCDLPVQEFRKNLVDESVLAESRENPVAWTSRHFRFFSWSANGVASKSGIGFGQAQCIYAHSEGAQLWYLLEDENNEGFLQKTWYSRTQSGKSWWLDNCRSQISWWRKWIAEQSPICRGGTRFGKSVVTILPVWNKNFSYGVPGADKETDSYLHWQFLRIWQVLWRPILESIVRQHHTDQKRMGLLKGQFAEWKKGPLRCYCSPVWVTNGGRIPWNATATCKTFKISCLMGRHHTKGGTECPVRDQ